MVKDGFKLTEVGVVPVEWEVVTLEEVGLWMGGGTPSKANSKFWTGSIPWISPKDFSHSPHIQDTEDHITEEAITNSSTNAVLPSDIVIVTRSGVLRHRLPIATVRGKRMAINQDIKALSVYSAVDSDYVQYYIKGRDDEIRNECVKAGTTVESVDFNSLKKYPIPLPPLPEQRRIAAVLSSVDGLLAGLDALVAKKEAIKAGVMEELLTGGRRLAGYRSRSGVEWPVVRLGDYLKMQVGFPFSSIYFNSKSQGIRLIKNRDLKTSDTKVFYTGPYDREFLVGKGDVLIGMDGDFTVCRWTGRDSLLNQRIGRLQIISADVNVDYIAFAIRPVLKDIEAKTAATTVKHLSHNDVEEIHLPLPPLPEQHAFAAVLSALDAELAALRARRAKVAAVKAGLLGGLLSGEVRV